MLPNQRADETEFDFSKKIIKAVDKQVNKFNYTPYKKLAFLLLLLEFLVLLVFILPIIFFHLF